MSDWHPNMFTISGDWMNKALLGFYIPTVFSFYFVFVLLCINLIHSLQLCWNIMHVLRHWIIINHDHDGILLSVFSGKIKTGPSILRKHIVMISSSLIVILSNYKALLSIKVVDGNFENVKWLNWKKKKVRHLLNCNLLVNVHIKWANLGMCILLYFFGESKKGILGKISSVKEKLTPIYLIK